MRIDERPEGEHDHVTIDELLSDGDGEESGQPRSRFRFVATVVAVFLILGGIFVFSWLGSRGPGMAQTSVLSVADYRARSKVDPGPAPNFYLPILGGNLPLLKGPGTLALSGYRGQVVVLNFWASWCTPCREEAPDLQSAWRDYRSKGVQFLGVDERDTTAAARAFQDAFGITYPSGFDPSGGLADDYGLVGLPSTFLIDRDGQIVYRWTGYLDGRVLRSALDEVLDDTAG